MAQSIEDILSRVNEGRRYGNYGEGIISTGLREFRQLQDMFRNGQLSGAEYSQIGDAILPQLRNEISRIAAGGSNAANAAWNAGGQDLIRVIKDYDTLKAAKEVLGREVTSTDLDSIRPYFESGQDIGRAYLTQLKQQEASSPENLRRRSGEFSDQVGSAFQEVLGRAPTADEIEHYGSGLASGQLDSYTLRDFVRQTPEFRSAEDQRFRTGLNDELSGYDQDAFKKSSEDILSRYTKAGINRSPALDFALTNLAGDIAKERGRYLAGISADQYGGNKNLARSDYENSLNRYLSNQDYERDLRERTMGDYLNRGRELADYDRQSSDYMRMLESMSGGGRRSRYGDLGAILGFGAGAATGNPQWAIAGGQAGRGFGGFWD